MSKENRVTDERLAEILANDERCIRLYPEILGRGRNPTREMFEDRVRMARELQSLRSKPVAGVEVKPLIDAVVKAADLLNVVILSGTTITDGHDGPHSTLTPLATQANSAWCDLVSAQRILSTLSLPAQAAFYGVWSGKIHIGTWTDEKTAREIASEYDSPAVVPLYASPQPEAVITDAMVERFEQVYSDECDHRYDRQAIRAALTAALKKA